MLQKVQCKNQKGFTLIELMIVIAIIGILAAIAIPNFIAYRNQAHCKHLETTAASTIGAMSNWFADPLNISFPDYEDLEGVDYHRTYVITVSINDGDPPEVVVEGSGDFRCPHGDTFIQALGGTGGKWE